MNLETASGNVITMGEAMKSVAVTGKQTEGSVEDEVLYEGSSGAAEVLPGKCQYFLIYGSRSKCSSRIK